MLGGIISVRSWHCKFAALQEAKEGEAASCPVHGVVMTLGLTDNHNSQCDWSARG